MCIRDSFRRLKHDRGGDWNPKFEEGVYLGSRSSDGLSLIGTPSGALTCRSVKQRPSNERWSAEALGKMNGQPWSMSGAPQQTFKDVSIKEAEPKQQEDKEGEQGNTRRRVQISRKDLQKHGYSTKCAGCQAAKGGGQAKNHTERCRRRIEAELEKTVEGRRRLANAKSRLDEAVAKKGEQLLDKKEQEANTRDQQHQQEWRKSVTWMPTEEDEAEEEGRPSHKPEETSPGK